MEKIVHDEKQHTTQKKMALKIIFGNTKELAYTRLYKFLRRYKLKFL